MRTFYEIWCPSTLAGGLSVCDKLQLYLDNSSEGAAHPSKGTTSASLRRHLGHTASHRVTFATAAHGQDDILHDVEHQVRLHCNRGCFLLLASSLLVAD